MAAAKANYGHAFRLSMAQGGSYRITLSSGGLTGYVHGGVTATSIPSTAEVDGIFAGATGSPPRVASLPAAMTPPIEATAASPVPIASSVGRCGSEWRMSVAGRGESCPTSAHRPEARGAGGVILLPAPALDANNVHRPHTTLQAEASARRLSVQQIGDEAAAEIRDWLSRAGRANDELDDLLDLRDRPSPRRRRHQS